MPKILQLREIRRSFKNNGETKYRETHRTITRLIKEAKEKWMADRCNELEELQLKHDHIMI